MTQPLTHERLLEVLDYSIVSGRFYWRTSKGNMKAGERAGFVEPAGYRVLSIDGRPYKAHVIAWLYLHREWPSFPIDHVLGNRDDNSFFLLRRSSPLLNQQNRRGPQGNNTHGFMGVKYDRSRDKWKALIRVNGKRIELGRRNTPEEAHELYIDAKRRLHEGCTL